MPSAPRGAICGVRGQYAEGVMRRPPAALRRVQGMGPSRLARYGGETLEIIYGAATD